MSETRKVVSGGAGTVAGLAKAKSMKGDKDAKESEGTFFGRRPPPVLFLPAPHQTRNNI